MSLIENQIVDTIGQTIIPRELQLDVPGPGLPSSTRIVNLLPLSTSAIGENQSVQFALPGRNLIKPGSLYLSFLVKFSAASHAFSFAGAAGSCAALWQSLQVSCGGVQLHNIQEFGNWMNNVVLPHLKSDAYMNMLGVTAGSYDASSFAVGQSYNTINNTGHDMNAVASAMFPETTTSPGFREYRFCMPLEVPCFNSKNSQAFPLFATQGVLITLQSQTQTKAIYGSDPTFTMSPISISDLNLQYQELIPEQSYMDSVRSGLSSGKIIKIDCEDVLGLITQGDANVAQLVSAQLSSVDAVLFGFQQQADSIALAKVYQMIQTDVANPSGVRNLVFLDNQQILQGTHQLDSAEQSFIELRRALAGSLTDNLSVSSFVRGIGKTNTVLTPASAWHGSYVNFAALRGISCRRYTEDSVSMPGLPARTLQFQLTNPGVSAAVGAKLFLWIVYSSTIAIDASMSVTKAN